MSDEEIGRFEGDLKAFLMMLRERFDREKLKKAVAVHRETWYAISKVKNDQRYARYIDSFSDEEIAGGVDMDAALDELVSEGEVRGIAKGAEKVNRLGIKMSEAGRVNDFMKSLLDKKMQERLFAEFGIEEE